MRAALILAAALAAGPGARVESGRRGTVDMVSASFSPGLTNPTHLGHWPSARSGHALFLSVNAKVAGSGAGTVNVGVLVPGSEAPSCSLSFPCALVPGDDVQKTECPAGTTFSEGNDLHIEYSHTCEGAPPTGTVVVGLSYRG